MKNSKLILAVLLLASLTGCQKEEVYEPVTINGTWVFSAKKDGGNWSDLKLSNIYVFNGTGGYIVKSLAPGSTSVTYYQGKAYADESRFSQADKQTYSAKKSAEKYLFESFPGTFTLTASKADELTFDYSGPAGGDGYKLSKVSTFQDSTEPDKPKPEEPDEPEDTQVKINGTVIQEGNDLAGLIEDKGSGKGIPGVIITDGYNCTKTDENGVYQFKSNALTRFIYYTTPADYKVEAPTSPSLPVFYKAVKPNGELLRTDFTLEKLSGGKETNWTFIGIGDPQCATSSNASRYNSETIPDIKKTTAGKSSVYAMTLGDIVFDSTDMWPTMRASMSAVHNGTSYIIFFQTIGNHDHDSLQPDTSDNLMDDYNATSTFGKYYGPVNYSFDRGDVHVVSMDDIMVTEQKSSSKSNGKTWSYSGGFTQAQIDWLKQDIALVDNKAEKMIFICCHIPFRNSSANHYPDVLKLMDEFKEAHLMIGHTHYTQNYIYTNTHKGKGGLPLYEHIHGSACGAWWTKSCSSTVSGEPSGYTVYDIEGAHIKDWFFKGTNKDKDFQLRVFDGNEIYYSSGYPINWYTASQKVGTYSFVVKGNSALKNCFVAQVFNDDDSNWSVALYKKSTGAKIGEFKRLANGTCSNAAMSAHYYNKKGKTSDSYRSWTASHYWYYKPASGNPATESDWEVVATQTIPGGKVSHTFKCSTLTAEKNLEKEFHF